MLIRFIEEKIKSAKYKILEDATYYGEIPGIQGVWANALTLEECRSELQDILEDWLMLKIRDREKIDGLEMIGARKHEDGDLGYA